jgi:hypothetical protein
MKSLVALFTVAMMATAAAQTVPLPKVVHLHNNATKESLGTATISGNRIYLRNKDGEHYATIEQNPDGTRTTYDPNGNVIPVQPK